MRAVLRAMLTVTVLLTAVSVGFAQVPLSLTLEEAVRRGVEHAPRLAEARAREASAEASVASRAALGKASLSATTSVLRTNHVDEFGVVQPGGVLRVIFPDIPSNYRARAELAVPVLTGGRVDHLVDAARADVRAAEADRHVTEEDVRLDVARAYWGLVTARESERVLIQALERADASVATMKARVDAGVLPPNELLSAQAQRARDAVRLVQARSGALAAAMRLARLIGETVGRPITPTTPVDQPLPAAADVVAQSPEALIARARERRAERGGLTERQVALRASGDAALAGLRPQVAALAAVEPARPNQRFVPRADEWKTSWDLGITLTWPLFDGGRARADRAAALAQATALGHRLEDFDEALGIDIRIRLLDLESGRAALTASDEAVAAAAEARRVVEERFRAGVATSTEILDAQLALLEAELERTRLAATLRVNEAELIRTVGGV